MTTHTVRCAGLNPGDGSTFVVTCPIINGATVDVAVQPGDIVARMDALPMGPTIAVQLCEVTASGPWNPIDAQPTTGELVAVVGPGEPDGQVGMVAVVRSDGTGAPVGIGALIAATGG